MSPMNSAGKYILDFIDTHSATQRRTPAASLFDAASLQQVLPLRAALLIR